MSKIVVELVDLMKAERELNQLLQTLRDNERHVRTVTDGIRDWTGNAADELRKRLESFFNGLMKQIQLIEEQKVELARYAYKMEQLDQQA